MRMHGRFSLRVPGRDPRETAGDLDPYLVEIARGRNLDTGPTTPPDGDPADGRGDYRDNGWADPYVIDVTEPRRNIV